MTEIEGYLSVSRQNGSGSVESRPVCVTIGDRHANAHLSVNLTLEDFAAAVLGMFQTPGVITRHVNTDKIGMIRETHSVNVKSSDRPYTDEELAKWESFFWVRNNPGDEYVPAGRHSSNNGITTYTYQRWVLAEAKK